MIKVTDRQLASAEKLIRTRVKTRALRRQALQELHEQIVLLLFIDDVKYLRWVSNGEPPVQVLSNWVRVDGNCVRQLNKDISESLGLNDL